MSAQQWSSNMNGNGYDDFEQLLQPFSPLGDDMNLAMQTMQAAAGSTSMHSTTSHVPLPSTLTRGHPKAAWPYDAPRPNSSTPRPRRSQSVAALNGLSTRPTNAPSATHTQPTPHLETPTNGKSQGFVRVLWHLHGEIDQLHSRAAKSERDIAVAQNIEARINQRMTAFQEKVNEEMGKLSVRAKDLEDWSQQLSRELAEMNSIADTMMEEHP